MLYVRACLLLLTMLIVGLLPITSLAQPQDQASIPLAVRPDRLIRTGYIGGPANVVAVRGAYAYVGSGVALLVLRVDDASQPVRAGYLMFDAQVTAVAVDEKAVYVATNDQKLYMVNVANPAVPSVLAVYDSPQRISDLAVANGYVYLAAGPIVITLAPEEDTPSSGLYILDTKSTPALHVVGTLLKPAYGGTIAVVGTHVFMTELNNLGSVTTIDVADPQLPKELGSATFEGQAGDITALGSFVYVAAAYHGSSSLYLFDVTNPALPVVRGQHGLEFGDEPAVAVTSGLAFIASRSGDTFVIDTSKPTTPTDIARIGQDVQDLAVVGDRLYAASGSYGLTIFTTSNVNNFARLDSYGNVAGASDIAAIDDYVYVTDGSLKMISPSAPDRVVQAVPFEGVSNIAVARDRLYVSKGSCSLRPPGCRTKLSVLERAEPAPPIVRGTWESESTYAEPPQLITQITASGNNLFAASGTAGLYVLDVSNPQAPALLSTYLPPSVKYVQSVAVTGTYALVGANNYGLDSGGLHFVDVSDPIQPIEKSALMSNTSVYDVAIRGKNAYLATENGLTILDITQPIQPVVVSSLGLGTVQTSNHPFSIAVDGDYAYVASGIGGLRLIDIADPAAPRQIDVYDTAGFALDVAVSGKRIFATAGVNGLFILELGSVQAYLPIVSR